MLRSVSVLTLVGVFAAVCASPVAAQRVGASKKGSILIYPKVELKWNAAGEVIQDTFVTILNDYPDDVFIHWYFVNGDEPLDAIFAGDPPTQVEPAHPGWNWVNCVTMLTQNEPTYFSAMTGSSADGSGGCQPFTTLDNPGGVVGRRDSDPENPGGRILRGFAFAYAQDNEGNEISWNHLSGGATLVNYAKQAAWEYGAYAFQAMMPLGDETDTTPGQLMLDGIEYDIVFDQLLLDFFTVGSAAMSGPAATDFVMLDTDLTLLPMLIDVRQDGEPPVVTKAHFNIWNANEDGFSGTTRCITCWDQTWLSQYELPNQFMLSIIHTDKGKARIDGVASTMCEYSEAAPLLGLAAKMLAFNMPVVDPARAFSGTPLVGQGEEIGEIMVDIFRMPDDLVDPDQNADVTTPPRVLRDDDLRNGKRSR